MGVTAIVTYNSTRYVGSYHVTNALAKFSLVPCVKNLYKIFDYMHVNLDGFYVHGACIFYQLPGFPNFYKVTLSTSVGCLTHYIIPLVSHWYWYKNYI